MAERAGAVLAATDSPPKLLLAAFPDRYGGVPFAARKERACEKAGVTLDRLILDPASGEEEARTALGMAVQREAPDGVLLQWPIPLGVNEPTLAGNIPLETDIDVMGPEAVRGYFDSADRKPPLTVSAALALLDANGVDLSGRQGVLVGPSSPFNRMFCEAMERRGAGPTRLAAADRPDLASHLARAELVIGSSGKPGLIRTGSLRAGAVVVDGGYANPGRLGDLDLSDGVAHLDAVIPVPGGLGPMTVSVMVEEVILRAEKRAGVL